MRFDAERFTPDFRVLFEALPGLYLAVLPDEPHFTIVAASDEYLRVIQKSREEITGRSVFDILPAGQLATVRVSLQRVVSTGEPDSVQVQRDGIEELYGTATNSVARGPSGAISYILHSVKEADKLSLFADASRTLVSLQESHDSLANLLTLARQFLPADGYAVWRKRPTESSLQLVCSWGVPESYSRSGSEPLIDLADEVLAVEDVEAEPLLAAGRGSYREAGIRAVLYVPIRLENKTIATLSFCYRSVHIFAEKERTVASALGNLACAALTTAELYDRLAALQAEAEASEARFRVMADSAPMLMWIGDASKQCTWFNRPWLEFTGSTQEQAHSYGWVEGVHPEDRERCLATYDRAFEKRETFTLEYRRRRHDGAWRWVLDRGLPRLRPKGAFAGYIGSCVDITERKQMEEALRESEERYRFMADSIPQMVWTAGTDGGLNYVSAQVTAYFGISRESLLQDGWLDEVHPDEKDYVAVRWKRSVATGEPYEAEFRLRRGADGAWRWFLVRALSMAGPEGHAQRWVGTCTDIHDQKESEAALRRVNRELEEFAYVASHDLQEPLRMVNIYTQLVLNRLPEENKVLGEYAAFIRGGVLRMEKLIRDLLTFSRTIQTDSEEVGTADLTASLAEAVSVLKDRIDQSGASITAEALPLVCGDTEQLAHVFQNLLSNSLKYRKVNERPSIHVFARQEGKQWIVSIRDNGIGFDQQYAARIFGLFKRLHKDEYPGTGLGLAICQRIIERYGGRIWAESRPEEGATFHFALPQPGLL